MQDFISINTTEIEQLQKLLKLSEKLKAMYKSGKRDLVLAGKTLIMLFEKQSLRTRMSFQIAMTDLGGSAIYAKPEDIGIIGQREPAKDIARVLSRYADGIMARTYSHETIIELAKYADIPVINGLTDWSHPCQAMADLLTIQEAIGKLDGIKIAYIGDGNNVTRSLAFACAKFGMQLICASPEGYFLDNGSIEKANAIAAGSVVQVTDPVKAIEKADVVYTDTWVSMGQEEEKKKRIADFAGYTLDANLISKAPAGIKIMHCLPAYRGLEISDEIVESKNSMIFEQAENRLHFQRALLHTLLK